MVLYDIMVVKCITFVLLIYFHNYNLKHKTRDLKCIPSVYLFQVTNYNFLDGKL